MLAKIHKTMTYIEELSAKLGYPITSDDYVIEDRGCPHKPNALPKGKCGVYMFFYNGEAMKIGKANIRSKARFKSHHYGFNAKSSLAKSLVADTAFATLGVGRENAGAWIKENMHRVEIIISGDCGDAATELIESVMHYAFRPRYEGALHKKGR